MGSGERLFSMGIAKGDGLWRFRDAVDTAGSRSWLRSFGCLTDGSGERVAISQVSILS